LVTEVKVASVKIEVEGESKISPDYVASRLTVKPGDTVDIEQMKSQAGIVTEQGVSNVWTCTCKNSRMAMTSS
jgi:hypothetical protein